MKALHPASVDEVRDEIRAISRSNLFAHSRRRVELLEYLCDMVLLGRQDEIKESTIALEVFHRTSEFDDKKDAIVRVEAHRLRQKLAKYYETEGAHDPVVIELLPGGYIPRFFVRDPDFREPDAAGSPAPQAGPTRFQPGPVLAITGAVALAFLLGVALATARHGLPAAATLGPAKPAPSPAGVPSSQSAEIRILAGSTKPYMDAAGRQWMADRYFQGGSAQPGPPDFLGRPPDPNLYRFMRYGDFRYDIPARPGVYELRLHFAEPTFRSGTDVGNEGGENQRHFTVLVNGTPLLYDFDVVNDSGISAVDVRAFRDISPAADGYVHLQFQAVVGPPFVNAIELVPGSKGRMEPIRIHAGQTSYTDHEGRTWGPDNYYVGGRLSTHKGDVTDTSDPDLYAGERYGNFSYAIPVPPGTYAATLYFAETYWDPLAQGSHKGGIGNRVFTVACNGVNLLPEFDILKEAKPFQAYSRTFHGLRPNGQGKLLFSFDPLRNYASLKAIEVTDESKPPAD